MEFTGGLKIINDMNECTRNSIFCNHDCTFCNLQHSISDKIEALQMARFALEQLIKGEDDYDKD